MVEQLRTKPGGSGIDVTIGDFAEVPVKGPFSLVFVTASTFFMLPTQEDQLRCFRNVAQRLRPGGRFLIEAGLHPLGADDRPMKVVEAGTDRLLMLAGTYNPANQISTGNHLQFGPTGVKTWPFLSRFVGPGELDLMARMANLRLENRWGDWKKGPPSATSRRHVSVYVKEG
jgi:SAM-dependent methyltransferase